ncbi:MAG: hypothetical protein OEW22_15190, partial [Rubrivivax sp.]|nr:hypothetical protein [Rubrivivax sp.]
GQGFKGLEASKPQGDRLLRAATVAPNASSINASVCGSGTEAATSPGRTATACNPKFLPLAFWLPSKVQKCRELPARYRSVADVWTGREYPFDTR